MDRNKKEINGDFNGIKPRNFSNFEDMTWEDRLGRQIMDFILIFICFYVQFQPFPYMWYWQYLANSMRNTMCFVLELQLKVKYLFKICYFKTLKRALKYCLFINFSNLFVHYIYLFYTDIVISFQLN